MPVLQNLKKFTFCAKLCGSEVINKCNPEVRRKTEALNNMKTAQYLPIREAIPRQLCIFLNIV